MTTTHKEPRLSLWTKLVFGAGDWSVSSFGTLRQIFYAIFITDVVGLEPRLASIAALIGITWDAINDPLVGILSDRLKSKWGRRRPFLLWFSIPFGLGFVMLWWAPPFESQLALAAFVTLAFMLSDTFQTLVVVPLYALTPEITLDYDERTSLTGYRMFFNLLASLVTAVAAPAIVDSILASGGTQQQGYLIVGGLFGGLAIIPLYLIFIFVRERDRSQQEIEQGENISFAESVRTAWGNIPFRYATGLYMLNWITFDLVALALPFFVTYWISDGDMLEKAIGLPVESAIFAVLLITSVLVLPFWVWMSKRFNKHIAYIIGMSFWAVVQLLIFTIQPGQISYMLVLSTLAGISVSTAHVLPDALFPDVIEWDELRTRRRQEGIYYGVKNFIRKMTGALAIFIALQVLGWFGYQSPPEGATFFQQSATTLMAIRILIGPFGAVLLFSAIAMAWFYPLTRERHARIRRLLARRKERIAK
ncbi:MAG: MFS transporter [Anaerolineae bacterium]|nr:MFS transporter [Anaerolineae bacterium]